MKGRNLMLAHAVIAAQMASARAVALPAPGTSDAQRLAPLLPRPELDARAPEIQREQAQAREAMKLSRRQQRRQKQEKRRADKALRVTLPGGPGAFDAGAPLPDARRLDLSLIHEPRRRAKLTAISTSTVQGRSTES